MAHGGKATLIDLSIARPPGEVHAGFGTPSYLAPEQARRRPGLGGHGRVGPGCDAVRRGDGRGAGPAGAGAATAAAPDSGRGDRRVPVAGPGRPSQHRRDPRPARRDRRRSGRLSVGKTLHEAVGGHRMPSGEQAGGGQHVVAVDHDLGAPGQLPAALDARRCCRRTRARRRPGGRGGARHPSRRAGRPRAGPCRCAPRPGRQGRPRPGCGRRAGAGPAPRPRAASCSSISPRRRRSGTKPGSSWRRLAASARSSRPAASTVETADQRMPRSPSTVRVTGVVATTSRERPASSGSSSTTLVDVGGGAADVDDDDVAVSGRPRRAPRQQLDAGEDHVGGGAADHRREVGAAAEVLAADDVGEEQLPDRRPGRLGREDADPRARRCRRRTCGMPARIAATSSRASTLPATTTGPLQPAATSARAHARIGSALPPSVPPVSRTTSGVAVAGRGQVVLARPTRRARPPPCRRWTGRPGVRPRR